MLIGEVVSRELKNEMMNVVEKARDEQARIKGELYAVNFMIELEEDRLLKYLAKLTSHATTDQFYEGKYKFISIEEDIESYYNVFVGTFVAGDMKSLNKHIRERKALLKQLAG